jgi:hypothetical protein
LINRVVSSVLFGVNIRSHKLQNLGLSKLTFVSSLVEKNHDPKVPFQSGSVGTLLEGQSDFIELILNQFSLIVDVFAVSELFDKSGQFFDPQTLHYNK